MDESQIADQLATKIQPTVIENPAVSVDPVPGAPEVKGYPAEIPLDDLTRYKLMDAFEIQPNYRDDPKIISKMDFIYKWAAELSNSTDYFMVMQAIRSAENALGYNPLKPRINRLYEFARLDVDRRRIETEMSDV